MVMKMVNINEAKAKLSEYLDAVADGETVIICNRNQPVAELRAVPKKRTEPRPIGGETGVVIPPSFYEPMSDDDLDAFDDGPIFPEAPKANRVADATSTDDARPRKRRHR